MDVGRINFGPQIPHLVQCPSCQRKQAQVTKWLEKADEFEKIANMLRWRHDDDESADVMMLLAESARSAAQELEEI